MVLLLDLLHINYLGNKHEKGEFSVSFILNRFLSSLHIVIIYTIFSSSSYIYLIIYLSYNIR